jgi:hypothetical protein
VRVRRQGGKLLWTFNTIPRPGDSATTRDNESWATNGNTGVWSQITVDEGPPGLYLPVEDPTSVITAAIGPATTCSATASSAST